MKVITLEEHIESKLLTDEINKAIGKPTLPNLSKDMLTYMHTSLPTPADMQDVDNRLKFMDKYGVDMQVLSYGNSQPQNLDPKVSVRLCKLANDELAKVVDAHPDRFAALAALPVGDPKAAASELKRTIKELNFKGVLLKGSFDNKFFDDPFFFPIFKIASDLDVPVYFHPSFIPQNITDHYFGNGEWSDVVTGIASSAGFGWHMDVGIQVMRMIWSGIFDKLPNLKLISGHWGEMIPMFLERLDDELTNYSGLKKPFSEYYRHNVWLTPSGMLSEPQLKFILDEMGPEHIMYSLDYPYKQPKNGKTFLTENSALTDKQRELFAHGNAEKLLKL